MNNPILILNIAANIIALLILVYIIFALATADRKYVKANLLLQYEAMRRDKVFRKSLGLLAISLLFTIAATILSIEETPDRQLINGAQFLSGVFRIAFFLYLLAAVKVTMR